MWPCSARGAHDSHGCILVSGRSPAGEALGPLSPPFTRLAKSICLRRIYRHYTSKCVHGAPLGKPAPEPRGDRTASTPGACRRLWTGPSCDICELHGLGAVSASPLCDSSTGAPTSYLEEKKKDLNPRPQMDTHILSLPKRDLGQLQQSSGGTCHPAVPVVCPGQHALRERCITAWLRGPSLLPLPHHPLWLLVWDPEAILLFLGPLCKHRKTDSMRADVGWGFPSRWPGCQCRVRLAS